jgi:endonuclease/exonuclease/phosphatase family metal-dependent hydrolase
MKDFLFSLVAITVFCANIRGQNLKLITYNIRFDNPNDGENAWINRKEFLCAQLAFYEPDIFGIQEALPNQVTDISKALTKFAFVGIARDGNGKGESSNIFYKKNKFQLLQQNTFWLSETPEIISKSWDAALNRICTYALLKDKKNKQIFWVFNTHLDHQGEIARTKGIELILYKIKTLNTQNYPVIFMGDFNSEPTEERIINLKTKMIDSQEISEEKPFGPSGTFNAFKHNEPVLKKIDYIFLSKESNIKVYKYAVLSDSKDLKYPSDHLPVYVEIRLN